MPTSGQMLRNTALDEQLIIQDTYSKHVDFTLSHKSKLVDLEKV